MSKCKNADDTHARLNAHLSRHVFVQKQHAVGTLLGSKKRSGDSRLTPSASVFLQAAGTPAARINQGYGAVTRPTL